MIAAKGGRFESTRNDIAGGGTVESKVVLSVLGADGSHSALARFFQICKEGISDLHLARNQQTTFCVHKMIGSHAQYVGARSVDLESIRLNDVWYDARVALVRNTDSGVLVKARCASSTRCKA